ncbi:MAG: glutathione peroxidase [Bacteroidia bacterium]
MSLIFFQSLLAISLSTFFSCTNPEKQTTGNIPTDTVVTMNDTGAQNKMNNTVYDFTFRTLEGKEIKLSDYKGKKIMIVNTASECGYTPQYEQLEAVYKKYQDKLIIIGFPTNDFGAQEPGSNKDIEQFCKKNYGVTFPVSEKITVKGNGMSTLYKWLTTKSLNGKLDSDVKWNFQKYLIDEKGNLIGMYESKVKPNAEEIIREIEDKR